MATIDEPRLGIIANPEKPGKDLLGDLLRRFRAKGIFPLIEEQTAAGVGEKDGLPLEEVAEKSDLLVILGGDGTILYMLRRLADKIKPLAAINTGTLGFMTCATEEECEMFVEAIAEQSYSFTDRMIVRCLINIPGQEPVECFGLNEVTLSRKNDSRVIHVEATINGLFANRYTGDGLIVATPTGSTAYSLSAGGPLVDPGADCFVLTPVCPHTLANRPMILDADSKIELRIPVQRDQLSVMVDGQLISDISEGAFIEVERAPFVLPLASLPEQNFFGVLHQKLGWTGSAI
ncbi:MAG: NAD(+)/NADH kinase [Verrucomicrobiales bacterium]|nr:NAD(+)/NADH kinase [Verrucomicrobiales bacterium]